MNTPENKPPKHFCILIDDKLNENEIKLIHQFIRVNTSYLSFVRNPYYIQQTGTFKTFKN